MRPALLALPAAVSLAAAPARADPHRTFDLTYARGPGASACPAGDGPLRRNLIRAMGYDPVEPGAPRKVIVTLDRRGSTLTGRVIRVGEDGKAAPLHAVDTTSPCAYLIEALALQISEQPDPDPDPDPVPTPPPPPKAAPLPEPPRPSPKAAPPPPPRPASTPPLPTSSQRPCLEVRGGFDGIATPLITPSASAGISPWIGLRPCALPLSFELGLRTTWSLGAADVGARYLLRSSYVSGAIAACWQVGVFQGCPVIEAGAVRTRSDTRPVSLAWDPFVLTAGARVGAGWRFSERFAVRSFVEVHGVAKGTRLVVGGQEILGSPPASVVLGIGVSVRVPSSTP